jgi:hypothetical protein
LALKILERVFEGVHRVLLGGFSGILSLFYAAGWIKFTDLSYCIDASIRLIGRLTGS